MKYLLLLIFITSLLTNCSSNRDDENKYDIYSSVLDKEFSHIPLTLPFIVGINDTIKDFKDELGKLIYLIENDNEFFKDYCKGDSSFKEFILSINTIKTDKEIMSIEKLKAKSKININLNTLTKVEAMRYNMNLSKIVYNNNKDKAILFVIDNSLGSWVFVELINKKWTFKYEIASWMSLAC